MLVEFDTAANMKTFTIIVYSKQRNEVKPIDLDRDENRFFVVLFYMV